MPNISLQQLLSTNFSLSPSGYTGSQGAVGYTGSAGIGIGGGGDIPKITNVQVTDNTYTVLDDTAVALTGGYIKLTGTGFASGCQVLVGTTAATSTTFVSSTEVRAQLPATTAGTYIIYLVNADGGVAIRVNGITFSDTPTWVTSSTLDSSASDTAISYQLSATGATTYTLQAGSSLPPGLTLSNVGLISGTVTGISSETTYSFTVVAVDAENQDSPRTFSVTITSGDQYWKYTTTLLSPTLSALPFNDDASTNNFPITLNGDVRPYNFNPYTPGYYSNYFDGSGDSLTLPSSASMSLDGQFTIECWVYWSGTATYYQNFVGSNNTFTSNASFFRVWGTGFGTATIYNKIGVGNPTHDGTSSVYSTNNLTPNTWNHVAATRDSNNIIRVFINGNLEKTGSTDTSVYDFGQGGTCIGDSPWDGANGWYSGYISNLRVIKGSCLYTASFTPSTGPLTAIANTSLLTCQSNRFIDNSTNNFAITKNGDTSVKSFNPYTPSSSYSTYGSTYFDGSGDFLSTPTGPAAFDFTSTKTLTLEFWVNSPAWPSPCCFFDLQECQPFRVLYSPGTISWQATSGGGNILTASVTLAVNTWYHIAFVRNTDTLYIFVDGVQVATGSYGNNWPSTAVGNVRIGTNRGDTWFVNGYMTDVRLVKGTALYTSNFTPPTSPLTAISGTSLLTCQSNQPANNNVFLDKSTNNFTITRSGNTTQGTFSPYGENWSNYFVGSGDYLTTPAGLSTAMGNGFSGRITSIECWIYPTSFTSGNGYPTGIIGSYDAVSANGRWILGCPESAGTTAKLRFTYTTSTGSQDELNTTGSPIVLNQWNHIAVTIDATTNTNTTIKLFANGVLQDTFTGKNFTTQTAYYGSPSIGGNYSQYVNNHTGYISNLRILTGAFAYTTNYTVSTTPLQPIAGTQLITCQSPSLVDNSTNNFAITKNGDVSVQKFGPFAGTTLPTPYYSAYFDGSSDYLTVGGTVGIANSAFTICFWFFPLSSSVIGLFDSGSGTANCFRNYPANSIQDQNDGSVSFSGSYTVNAWNWMCITKSGSSFTVYINGSTIGSATCSSTMVESAFKIGTINTGGDGSYYGYISNFQVLNTATVVAQPSAPTTAGASTTLLTCQNNTFIDNSTNNFAITNTNNTKPSTIAPFSLTYSTKQAYSPGVYSGSMYFDGTGDYLTVNDGLHLGTSDFTIEFWNYNNVSYVSTAQEFVNGESSGSGVTWSIAYQTYNGRAGFAFGYGQYGSYTVAKYVNGEWGKVKAWTHYAVQRRNGVIEIYVDGVKRTLTQNDQNSTFSDSTNFTSNYTSRNIANGYNGYISDFRITKGSAVYSSNFVPQNTPLQAIKNTTLVLNGTSASVYDSSTNAVFETVGDTKLSTTTVKFAGTTSIYLDGTGDYLAAPPPPSCMSGELGTGDFTIEYWMNASAAGTYVTVVGTQSIAGNSTAGIWRAGNRFNGANGIYFNYTNGGSFIDLTFSTTNYNDGAWHHVAFVRSSGSLKAYVDGTQVGSAQSVTQSLSSNQRMYVGYNVQDNVYYTGYITDLRITKGVARYTTNFTAPTIPLLNK